VCSPLGQPAKRRKLSHESAQATPQVLPHHASPATEATGSVDFEDLEDITNGAYARQINLDQLEGDHDTLLATDSLALLSDSWDLDPDSVVPYDMLGGDSGSVPAALPLLTPTASHTASPHGRRGVREAAPGAHLGGAGLAGSPPSLAYAGAGAESELDFVWIAPDAQKDRPLQGAAKSNATILLTGSKFSISVNSLLQEDNHIFEDLLPPLLAAKGLRLGTPQRILVRAVLLALLTGISNEELEQRYDLGVIARLREGAPLDKAMTEILFPRRKKGTTKYELAEGLARVIEDHNLRWPGKAISDRAALYLREKYDAKKGTHLNARGGRP